MQAAETDRAGETIGEDVKIILVNDTRDDSGIGSNSSSNTTDPANTGTEVNKFKNIIIEFQALNCTSPKLRESTFVQNAGKIPAADLSSIRGTVNGTVLSEG